MPRLIYCKVAKYCKKCSHSHSDSAPDASGLPDSLLRAGWKFAPQKGFAPWLVAPSGEMKPLSPSFLPDGLENCPENCPPAQTGLKVSSSTGQGEQEEGDLEEVSTSATSPLVGEEARKSWAKLAAMEWPVCSSLISSCRHVAPSSWLATNSKSEKKSRS